MSTRTLGFYIVVHLDWFEGDASLIPASPPRVVVKSPKRRLSDEQRLAILRSMAQAPLQAVNWDKEWGNQSEED